MALVPVGPAVGGPFVSINCPSNNDPAAAEDIRRLCAALLRNDEFQRGERDVEYVYYDVPLTPFALAATSVFSGNTWTNGSITLDVLSTKANDDLTISLWGNWQLNATSSVGDVVGRMRVEVLEDASGTPLAAYPPGVATIGDDGGNFAVPHTEPYALHYRHRITSPGTARVTIQCRSEDITGGAATGTIILVFSGRLDVRHSKRTT
jgi:hypothetical protein